MLVWFAPASRSQTLGHFVLLGLVPLALAPTVLQKCMPWVLLFLKFFYTTFGQSVQPGLRLQAASLALLKNQSATGYAPWQRYFLAIFKRYSVCGVRELLAPRKIQPREHSMGGGMDDTAHVSAEP